MIKLGPTGSVVKGDIFDIRKETLERALVDYDPNLYVKWNPHKYSGYGCWELRRRPEKKSAVDIAVFEGNTYVKVDYWEDDLNHVKDFPFLNYRIVEWVKKSDLWKKINFTGSAEKTNDWLLRMERAEQERKEAAKKKAREDMMYNLMQDKKVIRDFRDRINSGVNPALLSKFWDKS